MHGYADALRAAYLYIKYFRRINIMLEKKIKQKTNYVLKL